MTVLAICLASLLLCTAPVLVLSRRRSSARLRRRAAAIALEATAAFRTAGSQLPCQGALRAAEEAAARALRNPATELDAARLAYYAGMCAEHDQRKVLQAA